MVEVEKRLSRRTALAATLAMPSAAVAVAIGPAGASPSLSPPIATALAVVLEQRRRMTNLIEEDERTEQIFFAARRAAPEEDYDALRDATGHSETEAAVIVGWEEYNRAVDRLASVPSASVADLEAKFRAIADCGDPRDLCSTDFKEPLLRAIWRDLIRLSAEGAA